jgi:hypothetical protein
MGGLSRALSRESSVRGGSIRGTQDTSVRAGGSRDSSLRSVRRSGGREEVVVAPDGQRTYRGLRMAAPEAQEDTAVGCGSGEWMGVPPLARMVGPRAAAVCAGRHCDLLRAGQLSSVAPDADHCDAPPCPPAHSWPRPTSSPMPRWTPLRRPMPPPMRPPAPPSSRRMSWRLQRRHPSRSRCAGAARQQAGGLSHC